MALSPWPLATSVANRTAAVAQLQAAVRGAALDSVERANQLGMVGAALVENYAPGAPQEIRDEAVIRFAGYLAQSDFGTVISETSVESKANEYVVTHQNAWRNSGAAMLLSPWKIRRAGAIG